MPISEFQPVLDPQAMMGACAGAIVGMSAVVMEVQARMERQQCVLTNHLAVMAPTATPSSTSNLAPKVKFFCL